MKLRAPGLVKCRSGPLVVSRPSLLQLLDSVRLLVPSCLHIIARSTKDLADGMSKLIARFWLRFGRPERDEPQREGGKQR